MKDIPSFAHRRLPTLFGSIIGMSLCLYACKSSKSSSMSASDHAYTNELIHSSSPYLLQHAHNPVDWYPWGEEALAKAKQENKMMIISVGYAACHWCHVMEHESFEDTAVAKLMNEHFVAIKVDREERPDIDQIYMNAAYLTSGRGGWPLNALALPDGRPFFGGTYFPQQDWVRVLSYFVELREKDPEQLEEYAVKMTQGIQQISLAELNPNPTDLTVADLDDGFETLLEGMDMRRGGFNRAPKFPMPILHEALLRYQYHRQDPEALTAVLVTLDHMQAGGIYDQIGGGFARYSTDGIWKVPHFEKMLYDNGQLVSLYSKAYQLTDNPRYKQTIEETLGFVARELTDEGKGFYSSLDADSEGEEGKFYVWEEAEIDSLLGEDAAVFKAYYDVSARGNWEGHNILLAPLTPDKVLASFKLSAEELDALLARGKKTLLAAREERVRPGLDDKVLTAWNALMLQGYVDAYQALGDASYLRAALDNAAFIKREMWRKDGGLNRNYKDGKSSINAFADDYAFTISAFIGLYQVTFDETWLRDAEKLMNYTLEHFFDPNTGDFYYVSDEDPDLIARPRELSDNVIPGSNSQLARDLFWLGTYLFQEDYLAKAQQILQNHQANILKDPSFYGNYTLLMMDMLYPPFEVAIMGEEYAGLQQAFYQHYLPDVLLLGGNQEGALELLQNKSVPGETFIYVCQQKTCRLPVQEVSAALEQIKR